MSLPFEIHCEALRKNGHANLAHGICSLTSKKAAVYWWADDDYPTFPIVHLEPRQRCLYRAVEACDNQKLLTAVQYASYLLDLRVASIESAS